MSLWKNPTVQDTFSRPPSHSLASSTYNLHLALAMKFTGAFAVTALAASTAVNAAPVAAPGAIGGLISSISKATSQSLNNILSSLGISASTNAWKHGPYKVIDVSRHSGDSKNPHKNLKSHKMNWKKFQGWDTYKAHGSNIGKLSRFQAA